MKLVKKTGRNFVPTPAMQKISLAKKKIYPLAGKGKKRIKFWEKLAEEGIEWAQKWDKDKVYVQKGNNFKWFVNGKLNVCHNAVDRNLDACGDKPAIIFVPEPPGEKVQVITYFQLYEMVNKAAKMLIDNGIKKGDVVSIYLPMIPEVAVFMLACARIGAVHSVVFSAFSPDALLTRIKDGRAKLLITADKYYRKGKEINLLAQAEKACKGLKIKKIIMKREQTGRFFDELKFEEIEPEIMNSEDILFILYTSGTTGKPKGVIHVNGGYAVQAYWSGKFTFNLQPGEIIWCTADIGWVTGHTYAVYSPLLNGATTLLYEGMPDYPKHSRYLQIIEDNKVNVFYTAPTALRMFALEGKKYTDKFDLKSLKILGSVGEPIDEETWLWFFNNIGKGRCPLIDTYWQTETGSSVINMLPGVGPFIPTYAGKSFPGIEHDVVNAKGNRVATGTKGLLVQVPPFCPALLRGVWRNEKRYQKYFKNGVYITGDNAFQDKNGNYRLLGRADDVIKVAGHRLSTAEIENTIANYEQVSEAAVVAGKDKLKGEVPIAFVKATGKITEKEIINGVAKKISPIAKPAKVYFVEDLPKTRSGKIMRRILKALVDGEEIKNVSTLVNPECVEEIRKQLS